jgi:nitrogen regulatory protein PII
VVKIEAVIDPRKLDEAKAALAELEMLVSADDVDPVIAAVMRAARTRKSGDRDGRIIWYRRTAKPAEHCIFLPIRAARTRK